MKTKEKILDYIKEHKYASGSELADFLEISDRAVRKQLSNLMASGNLSKSGKPPKVYYSINESDLEKELGHNIPLEIRKIIETEFIFISPTGNRVDGFDGFIHWCSKTKQPVEKTAKEYYMTLKKYRKFNTDGVIDALPKMKDTFSDVKLDKLFYLDFYSIERFGKTKLGQMLLYAKQSQNKKLIGELIHTIKPRVEKLLTKYDIDGIGYIPPTVKREVQFMKELQKGFGFNKRVLNIEKIKTQIPVPQKTLSKLEDRIENAKRTIIVNDKASYGNVLLIDDAVGSGATLNETASQIRDKGICKGKIIGLSITGSYSGFDVISEV